MLIVEETLKRHEDILDNLASSRGYHIAKTYYEVVSGESIAARPEVQKLLEEVSAGIYTGVLVVDLERLARGNGADQAYISQVFQYSETKIITPLKTYDPTNAIDEIKVKKRDLSAVMSKLEESDSIHSSLVPQTEKLLESYDEMSVEERNKILKEVLHKIVYKKENGGKICIDLYPRLPKI